MSQVTLQVGGRPYTVSCADGEEAHVRHLASIIDDKLTAMGGSLAPGDAKNLLFAALILADEVEEARRAVTPSPDWREAVASSRVELKVARNLETLADRLEKLAATLESAAGSA